MHRCENDKRRFKMLVLVVFHSILLIMSMGMTNMKVGTSIVAMTVTQTPITVTVNVTKTITDYTMEPDTTETITEYHTTIINNPRFNFLSSGVIYVLTGTLALGGGMLLAWSYERVRKIK